VYDGSIVSAQDALLARRIWLEWCGAIWHRARGMWALGYDGGQKDWRVMNHHRCLADPVRRYF
jgi:hypothetical protein